MRNEESSDVSFVSSTSGQKSKIIKTVLCVMSYYIWPRYIQSLKYYQRFDNQ